MNKRTKKIETSEPSAFIIRCNSRKLYFVAIHGFTPMYGPIEKAKQFATRAEAATYGNEELFNSPLAFTVEPAFSFADPRLAPAPAPVKVTPEELCREAAQKKARALFVFSGVPKWAKGHESEVWEALQHYAEAGALAAVEALKKAEAL